MLCWNACKVIVVVRVEMVHKCLLIHHNVRKKTQMRLNVKLRCAVRCKAQEYMLLWGKTGMNMIVLQTVIITFSERMFLGIAIRGSFRVSVPWRRSLSGDFGDGVTEASFDLNCFVHMVRWRIV